MIYTRAMVYTMVYTIWYIPIAAWYIPSKSGVYHEATFQMDFQVQVTPHWQIRPVAHTGKYL